MARRYRGETCPLTAARVPTRKHVLFCSPSTLRIIARESSTASVHVGALMAACGAGLVTHAIERIPKGEFAEAF